MKEAVLFENLKWLNIENPNKEDILYLKENFRLNLLDLEEVLVGFQQSKVDIYKNYAFLVFYFPVYLENEILKIFELDIFIGKDFLITISNGKFEIIKNFFQECRIEKNAFKYFGKGLENIVYILIDKLVDSYFVILKNIGKEIENINNILTKKIPSPKLIEKISEIRHSLILIHTAIKPQISLFVKISEGEIKFLNVGLKKYWENLTDHAKKIIEQTEDYLELIEGLAHSYESLISYKTNEIIKILTIFSAILLPLTFIASIYGMNINLPIAEKRNAFLIISLIMIAIMAVMLFFFKRKKWL